MTTMTIDYDEFQKRLHELLERVTFPEDRSTSTTAIGFNHGASTLYYGACNVLCKLDIERIEAERRAREASA